MEVFDVETNGLLEELDTVHCLCIKDTVSGEKLRFNNQPEGRPIEEGLRILEEADCIGGHNIIGFDIPAIQKVYPWFNPKGTVRDSLVISLLIWTDLKERDFRFVKTLKGKSFPMYLIGRHSLEAWGARIGAPKDDYAKRMKEKGIDPWAEWNPEMEFYCGQDVDTNTAFFEMIDGKNYSEEAIQLEHDVRVLVNRQERFGFMFDMQAAVHLYAQLVDRKQQLTEEIQEFFKPFFKANGITNPKKSMNRKVEETGVKAEYTAGCEYTKIKLVEFNPGSGQHIAKRLQTIYGWKPKLFTETGEVQVDEAVLKALPYEPIPLLVEYLLVNKRIGQIAEGKKAWFKFEKNGRIHGRVNTNGAVTGRMTHSDPNMAQVPASYSKYGKECRSCFIVPDGKVLLGFDADALELRCLAGYMAKWDAGEYVKVVLEGKKEDGTDIHTRNMHAIGIKSRDDAKTWFYAFIYGAGDEKLGSIIASSLKIKSTKKKRIILGRESRERFMDNLPALGSLVKAVKKAAKNKGWLKALDGRRLNVRSEHAALNTLLQACGAILMKKFLVLVDEAAQAKGWIPGVNYEFVANVHDEVQVEIDKDIANEFGEMCKDAIKRAGQHFNFRCPIEGQYQIGTNWSETH